MVQHRNYPTRLATLHGARSDYWKVWSLAHFDNRNISSKALKRQIDACGGGCRQYTSQTNRARLGVLAYRAQRRLRCYDGDAKNLLRTFCHQRGLSGSLQRANKPVLIEALESADEEATFDRFLDLPPELRVMVYQLHCKDFDLREDCMDHTVLRHELTYPSPPAITQVCSLVRRESLTCFYQAATFAFILMTRPKGSQKQVPPAGAQFLQSIPAESIAMMRHITFRGYCTSASHGIVGEKTEMTIDTGAGRGAPKVVNYQGLRNSSSHNSKDKTKLARKLERRALKLVRGMAGRSNDKKVLKSDFKALEELYMKYAGKIHKLAG